jgi:hypothetical protein
MRHSRRSRRGGDGINYQLTPANFDGQGVGTSGVDIQFVAGQAGGRRRRTRGRRSRSRRGGAMAMLPLSGGRRTRRSRRTRRH